MVVERGSGTRFTADPKLIEAVARAIGLSVIESRLGGKQKPTNADLEWEWKITEWRRACEHAAAAALAAVNASETHWVAPAEATEAMKSGYEQWAYARPEGASRIWRCLRDTYLAETKEAG